MNENKEYVVFVHILKVKQEDDIEKLVLRGPPGLAKCCLRQCLKLPDGPLASIITYQKHINDYIIGH